MNDENAKYWLAFASIEKIGSVFIQTLFNHFGSVKSAWCAGPEELYKIESLTKRQVSDFLECRRNTDPDKCFEFINKKNIKYI